MDFEALASAGWKNWFAQAFAGFDQQTHVAARVVAVHRNGLSVYPELSGFDQLPLGGRWYQEHPEARPTIGDWVVIERQTGAIAEFLERTSVIKRISPSTGEVQLIAANIDTAFLVTSCNADFSPGRLERYLAVVNEADIQPVVVLTKTDQTADVDDYLDQVKQLSADLPVEAVNALDVDTLQGLRQWCVQGQTIALLGSSGVGKSTLVNSLAGQQVQLTAGIREADGKGRHTTTHRSLHFLPGGGVILDSPGMREFQIADATSGVHQVFEDIETLTAQCRFADCQHDSEPDCAVQAALADGRLDERRLQNYFKLQREEQYNSETIAQRHARVRQFDKKVRASMNEKKIAKNSVKKD